MKISILFIVFILLYMVSMLSRSGEITVAAASNFTAPMKVLAAEFERTSGHKVKLAFGSSGKLYAQIKNGAPFQVLFSADQAKPRALQDAGLGVPGSLFTYAIGALTLWSPTADLSEAALRRQLLSGKLALANPRVAPYGVAAVEVLANLSLTEKTRANWIRGENISQTYQFVSSGNAAVGFVALSQVMEQEEIKKGSAWIIPPDLYRPVRQDTVLLSSAKHNSVAWELLAFMRGAQARKIIHSFGYLTEPPAP